MSIKDYPIYTLEDLDKLRTAPILNKQQSKSLLNQVEYCIVWQQS